MKRFVSTKFYSRIKKIRNAHPSIMQLMPNAIGGIFGGDRSTNWAVTASCIRPATGAKADCCRNGANLSASALHGFDRGKCLRFTAA